MITGFIKTSLIKQRFIFDEEVFLNYVKTIQRQENDEVPYESIISLFPPLIDPLVDAVFGTDGLFDSVIETGTNHARFTVGTGLEEIELTIYSSQSYIIKMCFNIYLFRSMFIDIDGISEDERINLF